MSSPDRPPSGIVSPDPSLASAGVSAEQGDGTPPRILLGGTSAGEHGVAVVHVRFEGGAHLAGAPPHHVVHFHPAALTLVRCRMADRRLEHHAGGGSFAITPAGMDIGLDSDAAVESLALLVAPERLAFAASQGARLGAHLVERMCGRDPALQRLAQALAAEVAGGRPNGPFYWSCVAERIVEHLVEHHLSCPALPGRGRLDAAALGRLNEFIHAHLHESFGVEALAHIAGQSRFHFSRIFSRSVGMSPHRYVMQLRLERARALLGERRLPLSDVAQRTGFTDQSHLTRWSLRIYGISPGKLGNVTARALGR